MKTQSAITQNKSRNNKSFMVIGYAVNKRGLTKHAETTVTAANQKEAVTRAAADLRWQGLTYFKALKVYEV
ncbi:hypothetical protein FD430_04825 [Salmonella enterica]|nr:hypothetical protein [Salmonella enterica]EDR1736166.1 hypothetical protein [Salmonella enterica subsp. diarizonae]EDT8255140.1 hypothetical protein [Salmonella enterica subsp. diarizonae serovar 48:z52:z]EAR4762290.1 hypothetical protein [Salmonella enterica]EAV7848223.1 hypothetical protein [Salmonella enterica]